MQYKEINKPGFAQRVLALAHRQPQHSVEHTPLSRKSQPKDTPVFWEKLHYDLWIPSILNKFKIDDFVTMHQAPIRTGSGPAWYGKVSFVNEICKHAEVDIVYNEPKALVVTLKNGLCLNFAPKSLRHLTTEEVKFVLSRDNPTFSRSDIPPGFSH